MPILRVSARIGLITSVLLIAAPLKVAAQELTLAETERLALEHAPWYAHHRANVDAAAERAVYEGRLPDPQLTLGYVNVPTDTWKLDQEDMTMTMVGVRQSFPPGDTLALKSRRAEKELTREEAKVEVERRNLLRQVRQAWLQFYFQQESLRLLQESRRLQQKQLEAAGSAQRRRCRSRPRCQCCRFPHPTSTPRAIPSGSPARRCATPRASRW